MNVNENRTITFTSLLANASGYYVAQDHPNNQLVTSKIVYYMAHNEISVFSFHLGIIHFIRV